MRRPKCIFCGKKIRRGDYFAESSYYTSLEGGTSIHYYKCWHIECKKAYEKIKNNIDVKKGFEIFKKMEENK